MSRRPESAARLRPRAACVWPGSAFTRSGDCDVPARKLSIRALVADLLELLAHRHAELLLEDVLVENVLDFLRIDLDRLACGLRT